MQRVYSHDVLKGVCADVSVSRHLDTHYRSTFPLDVEVVLSGVESTSQMALLLLVSGRLRAKGYRVYLSSVSLDPERRTTIMSAIRRFFWSLGETNIVISMERRLSGGAVPCHLRLVSSDSVRQSLEDHEVTLRLPDVDAVFHGASLDLATSEYLAKEVIEPWFKLTETQDRVAGGLQASNGASTPVTSVDEKWNALVNEVQQRQAYAPILPRVEIELDRPIVQKALRDPDALQLLLRAASFGAQGSRLEDLASVVNDSYPRLLRGVKKLVGAELITLVSDRCFMTPATYQVVTTPEVEAAHLPVNGHRRRLPIACIFPPGAFGYDTDDAEKCTAVRMIKAGLAEHVKAPAPGAIVLDPSADEVFGPGDFPAAFAHGLCLIDAPWYRIPAESLAIERRGDCRLRRLEMPRQDNAYYAATTKISTAGAAAYAVSLAGCEEQTREILDLFEWGTQWRQLLGVSS